LQNVSQKSQIVVNKRQLSLDQPEFNTQNQKK